MFEKIQIKFSFLAAAYLLFGLSGQALSASAGRGVLGLRIDPAYFSPNGDGIQDQAFFYPVLESAEEINRWRLIIRGPGSKVIRKMSGAGFSALLKWDGTDRKNLVLPDGSYSAALEVWGTGSKLSSPQKLLVIDTLPPVVAVAVSTSVLEISGDGEGSLGLTVRYQDPSPVQRWLLQVLDVTGRTVHVEWSSGSLRDVHWNGTDDATGVFVPQGHYRIAFQAWDQAGNESQPIFTDVAVKITAKAVLEKTLQWLQPVETDLGLLLQMKANDLFYARKKKPLLTPESEPFLREAALIINAYPDVQVRLDGYAWILNTAEADRARSSLYAWSVYSYLVKKGNVKPSRLTVRGRGRSAMFDRRSIDVPIVRDGIEILLEGNREW